MFLTLCRLITRSLWVVGGLASFCDLICHTKRKNNNFCVTSGIRERELGQSLCRRSQHFWVSDRQPWEPDCSAVYAALGTARWKRIPRSPERSSEGTLLTRSFIVNAEYDVPSEVLSVGTSPPLILCFPLSSCLPPTLGFLDVASHPSSQSIYW